jgi:hypothetical protein
MAILRQYTAGPQRIAIVVAGFARLPRRRVAAKGAPHCNDTPSSEWTQQPAKSPKEIEKQ